MDVEYFLLNLDKNQSHSEWPTRDSQQLALRLIFYLNSEENV